MNPRESLIRRAAELMSEQAAAYGSLERLVERLTEALVSGAAPQVESLTRAGESELNRMRARLVAVMTQLTAFADSRPEDPEQNRISPEARAAFESASNELNGAARSFLRAQRKASALASGGATYAAARIENCGVEPTTYRAPYARQREGARWA
jgi:ATP-dependent Clp protease ATP-binding subunit ClpA